MSKELPRYERRPSSPSALGGASPFDCNLSFKTLLGFLSTRVLRGGSRLVIQLIVAGFGLVLLGNLFTSPSSDLIIAGSKWSWSPFGSSRSDADVGNGQPGGLRLIVFGSPDIATPSNGKGNGKGWTEMLCEEVSIFFLFFFLFSLPLLFPFSPLTTNNPSFPALPITPSSRR